ncbi:MAG: YggT family protein [Thermoanaerobaculia bacterium]
MMTLIYLLVMLLNIYTWVIIIRAVMSWVAPVPSHPLAKILVNVTEPVLKPLRRLVPPSALGGIDVSPILAILAIQVIRYGLISFGYSLIGAATPL